MSLKGLIIPISILILIFAVQIDSSALAEAQSEAKIESNSKQANTKEQKNKGLERPKNYFDINIFGFDPEEISTLNQYKINSSGILSVTIKKEKITEISKLEQFWLLKVFLKKKENTEWSPLVSHNLFNRELRMYDMSKTADEEIKYLESQIQNFNINAIWWIDENFMGQKGAGMPFYEGESEPLFFTRYARNRPELLSLPLVRLNLEEIELEDGSFYKSQPGDQIKIEIYSLQHTVLPTKPFLGKCHENNPDSRECISEMYNENRLNIIPQIEDVIILNVSQFGYSFNIAPTVLYASNLRNSEPAGEFNIVEKGPGIGNTISVKYETAWSFPFKTFNGFKNTAEYFSINYLLPGITLSYLSLNGNTKFTPGLSWRLPIPLPDALDSLHDHIKFFYGLYDLKKPVLGVVFDIRTFEMLKVQVQGQASPSSK
jgi:hypothetical protein